MNREDIIRMADSTGSPEDYPDGDYWLFKDDDIVKFAQLVAAHERDACASEADKLASLLGENNHLSHQGVAMAIAAKIRMRT